MINRSSVCHTSIGQRRTGKSRKLLLNDIQPPIRNMIQTYQRTILHDKAGQNLYVWTTKPLKTKAKRISPIRNFSPPNQFNYSFLKTTLINNTDNKTSNTLSLPPMKTISNSTELHAKTSRPFIKDSNSLDEILYNGDGPKIEFPDRKHLQTIRPLEFTRNIPQVIDLGELHRHKVTDQEPENLTKRKSVASERITKKAQTSRKSSESGRLESIRLQENEDYQEEEEDFSQFSLGVEFEPPPDERKPKVNKDMIKILELSKQLANESTSRKKSLKSSRSGFNSLRL